MKKLLSIILAITVATSLVACGKSEETTKQDKKDKVVTKNTEKKDTNEQKSEKKTELEENAKGKLSIEAVPLFEELYKDDSQKEFKLDFAKEAINKMDKAVSYLPDELTKTLFTSKGIVKFEGPMYQYNVQATGSKDGRNKNNCFYGFFGEVSFYDDPQYLVAEYEMKLSLKSGTDKEMILTDEAKKIIEAVMPEVTAEDVQQKVNESIANNGKNVDIIKDKYKSVKAYGNVSDRGVNITVAYKVSNDYPRN